jgi:hypothetical protein
MSKDLVQAFGDEVIIEVGYPKRHMSCVGVMQHTPLRHMRWLAECNNQPQTKGIIYIYIVPSRVIRDKPRKTNMYNSTVTCNRDCLKAKFGRIGQNGITSISLPVCTCDVLKEE